jgi:hypothetical protein
VFLTDATGQAISAGRLSWGPREQVSITYEFDSCGRTVISADHAGSSFYLLLVAPFVPPVSIRIWPAIHF